MTKDLKNLKYPSDLHWESSRVLFDEYDYIIVDKTNELYTVVNEYNLGNANEPKDVFRSMMCRMPAAYEYALYDVVNEIISDYKKRR